MVIKAAKISPHHHAGKMIKLPDLLRFVMRNAGNLCKRMVLEQNPDKNLAVSSAQALKSFSDSFVSIYKANGSIPA